jgi:(p)ppGpp synthase/HD superfamily hydrolase
MATLERAIAIAVQAHAGKVDRGGKPYILHPLHLMLEMRSDAEKMVAVLHDVVEDSDWTLESLRAERFPGDVVEAVDHLTKRPGESYEAFIERVRANTMAVTVKAADLKHNLDLSRIACLTNCDIERIRKYQRALSALLSVNGVVPGH